MRGFEGSVHKFGDDINTDYIISSRRKRDTLDLRVLKNYLMADIDPGFADRLQPGDMLAAGDNFGCGSAMEVASLVIKAAGIQVVLAKSFARSFYRNGINGGLLLVECNTDNLSTGSRLKVEMGNDRITVLELDTHRAIAARAPGGLILDIFKAGGLVNYIRVNRSFPM